MLIYFHTGYLQNRSWHFGLLISNTVAGFALTLFKTSLHSGHTYCCFSTDENIGYANLGAIRDCCEILVKTSGKQLPEYTVSSNRHAEGV